MTVAGHTPSFLRERARARIVLSHLRLLRAILGEKPARLGYWMVLRAILSAFSPSEEPLSPPNNRLLSRGASLQIPELRSLLADDLLGAWSLDATVIHFLWRRLLQDRPRILIECGAGVSSLVLATYAKLMAPQFDSKPLVLSLEQDLDVVKNMRRRLSESALGDQILLLHAPVLEDGRYVLNGERLRSHVGSEGADLLLIDGPAGPAGCRKWTLSLLAPFCRPGARWYLDDAFRGGEIDTLRSWASWPGIRVEGICALGKGLGTGTVEDPWSYSRHSQND